MAKYQKYAEYQDSGVEWLGEIPSHWDVWKLNHFAPIITCGVAATPEYQDEGIPFLSAQNVKKKKVDLAKGYKFISQEKHNELTRNRKPKKGDILLSRVGTIGEGCIIDVDFEFSIFVSLTHLRLIQQVCVNEFFIYLTESSYVKALHGAVTLVGGGVGNLNVNDLREYLLPIPPLSEQKSIVNFLDHETTRIDSLIEKQQLLIQLLKEKRQAVISHAVTKGLNPNVALKDSGVEWLGQVPEHWTVSKLKYFVNVVDCKHITAEFFDEGIPLASIGEVKGWKVNLLNAKLTNEKHYQELIDGNRTPQVGDIIYTRNATVGEASLVHSDLPKFALGQDVCLIHIIQKLLPEFLLHFLKSEIIKIQLNSAMVGSTFKRINVDDIRNYLIVIPPAEEQESILKDLSKKIEKYDLLIDFAVQQIKLMQERRTALISSAVTGKIDVSDWQNPNKNNEAKTEFSA